MSRMDAEDLAGRFRRLLPDAVEELTARDVAGAVVGISRVRDRPFVLVNMIATADGRTTVAGRAGPIGNRADRELFLGLRDRADAVMAGAGTVRAEGYGPMRQLVVVASRSLELSPDLRLFASRDSRVVVITPSAAGEIGCCAATVHYLREQDLRTALRRLRSEHGVRFITCEGGPHLNAELFSADLVDELHLVVAPKLVGGRDPLTLIEGPSLGPALELELISLHESGGYLFARYGVTR